MNDHVLYSMLAVVADSLGKELVSRVAFVGGCVVPLLITEPFSRDRVRSTEDVDLIIEILSWPEYHKFGRELRMRGFHEAIDSEVSCRWRVHGVVVDVMPTEKSILGFSSHWYPRAVQKAQWMTLDNGVRLRVVTPDLFLATKIEAFEGRGAGDFLGSSDIEDILNLISGRPEIITEVQFSEFDVRGFVSDSLGRFMESGDFEYAVQSHAAGEALRESELFERLDALRSFA